MSRDLTRWNRAGLSRLRYVDGNAVVFYEQLREALGRHFGGKWPAGPASDETAAQRERRLLANFNAGRGDWGLELARQLARGTHVLMEYLDAYANEATLRTATQWDHVRRLVEMLDYHPAPPASASTPLIVSAKPGRRGRVARGLAAKYSPIDGRAPVVFETLADLEVDASLNALRLAGHERSPEPLSTADDRTLLLAERVAGLKPGEPVVFEDERSGFALVRLIAGVSERSGRTVLTLSNGLGDRSGRTVSTRNNGHGKRFELTLGTTWIHLKPADRMTLLGPAETDPAEGMIDSALVLKEPPRGLERGEVVYVGDGRNEYYRRVTSVEANRVRLAESLDGELYVDAAWMSRAVSVPAAVAPRTDRVLSSSSSSFSVPGNLERFASPTRLAGLFPNERNDDTELRTLRVIDVQYHPPSDSDRLSGRTVFTVDAGSAGTAVPTLVYFSVPARQWPLDSYVHGSKRLPLQITTTTPKLTAAGDFVVIASGAQFSWGRLSSAVNNGDDTTALAVDGWYHRAGGRFYFGATRVYGRFTQRVRVADWNINAAPMGGRNRLTILTSASSDLLVRGRTLWVERLDGSHGQLVMVNDVESDRTTEATDVMIDPPLSASAGFTTSNTVIRGNVVMAGHGEAQNERILGSGVGSLLNQSFVLESAGVSFIADPTFPAGVRADIDVLIDAQRWQQVPSLEHSSNSDSHYTVRMTEAGFIRIEFGDGVHGRRLPTGSNNVRVRHRIGTGLAGNTPAGSLEKLVRPNAFVDTLRQPLAATGGGDMESRDALKRNAPASVLTLERAVSLQDYAHLAAAHAAVWRARAFALASTPRRRDVEVVVVPAGGAKLDAGLQSRLESFLQAHSQPGVSVTVSRATLTGVTFKITVRLDSREFDPQIVVEQVAERLRNTFTLERREVGAPLYLSEVYAVVEAIAGVRNSTCEVQRPEGREEDVVVQRLTADEREVLFLDTRSRTPALTVNAEEFAL